MGSTYHPPPGQFRVLGHDQFDRSNYVVGDYATLEEACQAAREQAATPNGSPTSFSDRYFVCDDGGVCRYEVAFDDLPKSAG